MFPRAKSLLRRALFVLALTQVCAFLLAPGAARAQATTAEMPSSASSAASTDGALPVLPSRSASVPTGLSVGIVVDASSAMRTDAASIRTAVERLIKPMRDDDEAFVVAAKDKPQLLQDFTSDPEEIRRKLEHLKLKGKTPLLDSIMEALNRLDDASNERTALVVLTAGEDDASSTSVEAVKQKLSGTHVPIYCIAAKKTSWESQGLLQELAARNGGSALFPRSDKDLAKASGEISRRLYGENALAAKEKPLAVYDSVVVRSIPVASGPATENFPEGDNVILQKVLVKNLRAKGLFTRVIDGTTPDGVDQGRSAASPADAQLEVLGTVLEFKPASQRQTRFMRLGGRSALVKVQFLFRDVRTGKIVMKSVEEGKVDTGVLGGNPEKVETQAVMRVVDHLVDDIERSR